MKKTITLAISAMLAFSTKAQLTVTADFEEYNLPLDTFYLDTSGKDFTAAGFINFQYDWTKSNWGNYWSGGFAYSTMRDSVTEGYSNEYSSITGKGFNNSNTYAVGQNKAGIKISSAILRGKPNPTGFYITNSTYAYKSMLNGDWVGKKFGGSTGNDPDWFKLTIKSSYLGVINKDSSIVYLADFRSSDSKEDYILKEWKYVNISNLGIFDSLYFILTSSDIGTWGMNTPAYFCMDNLSAPLPSSIKEHEQNESKIHLLGNPIDKIAQFSFMASQNENVHIIISDVLGKIYYNETNWVQKGGNNFVIDVNHLNTGMFYITVSNSENQFQVKFIKE